MQQTQTEAPHFINRPDYILFMLSEMAKAVRLAYESEEPEIVKRKEQVLKSLWRIHGKVSKTMKAVPKSIREGSWSPVVGALEAIKEEFTKPPYFTLSVVGRKPDVWGSSRPEQL